MGIISAVTSLKGNGRYVTARVSLSAGSIDHPLYFFKVRSRGAILARLLSPTRYDTLPLSLGEWVPGFVDLSGVCEVIVVGVCFGGNFTTRVSS